MHKYNEYTHEELDYFADEWFPEYITTKVEPVTVLPSPEMIRVTELVRNIERRKEWENKK